MKHLIRIAGVGIAVCATMIGAVSMVSAHAEYDHSIPGAGETVATSPAKVTIVFNLEIQTLPGTYGVAVTNASGASVTSGSASVGSDKMSLSIALQPNLPAGTYSVEWNNTSADDGDPLAEGFTFNVGAAPSGSPTAMPAASHDHPGADSGHDAAMEAEGATTGLISIPMSSQGGSGVSGHADIFPVDGGTRTRVDEYLNGLAPGSSHMTHIHMNLTCSEAPGAHAADLPNIVANDQGNGVSSSVVNVPFSTVASGRHVILAHAGADTSDKTVIACGDIPAQPATEHDHEVTGTIAPPNTGDGSMSTGTDSPLAALAMLAAAGAMIGAAGATMRARRRG